MHEKAIESLKKALKNGEVLIVCGAGVSSQATDGKAPSWFKLIEQSVDYACERKYLDETEAESTRPLLAGNEPKHWLRAAGHARTAMDNSADGVFKNFLDQELGKLDIVDGSLVESLHDLRRAGNVLATTNYDDVLDIDAVRPITSLQPIEAAKLLKQEGRPAVWHIHGHWQTPESVIFSDRDYESIAKDDRAQFLQQYAAIAKKLLFIGCSTDGLADANVGKLLKFLHQEWAGLGNDHFVLCRATDIDVGWPESVQPIVYGDDYSQLSDFLSGLKPASLEASKFALPPNRNMLGRGDALDALVKMALQPGSPIVVSGALGMGKTTLALAAAYDERIQSKFEDRIRFVDLEAVTSGNQLLREVSAACGLPTTVLETEIIGSLDIKTRVAPFWILLDNLETTLAADRAKCNEALSHLGSVNGLHLILTTRGVLPNLAGGARQLDDVDILPFDAAKALFLRHAGPKHSDSPHLLTLLQDLDGHALSIEIVAKNAAAFGDLEALRSNWTKLLSANSTGKPSREDSVDASVQLSLSRLTASIETRLAALVALMPSGMLLADLEVFLPDSDISTAMKLYSSGLIGQITGRVRMLAPVRESVQRLQPPEPFDERVVTDYFLSRASDGINIFEASNQIYRYGLVASVPEIDFFLLRALREFFLRGDRQREVRDLYDCCRGVYSIVEYVGSFQSASFEFLSSNKKVEKKDKHFAVLAINAMLSQSLVGGRISEARIIAKRAHRLANGLGLSHSIGNTCSSLGELSLLENDIQAAREHYEAALSIYEDLGSLHSIGNALYSLGEVSFQEDDLEGARKQFDAALSVHEGVGNRLGIGSARLSLGELSFREDDLEGARAHYDAALSLFEDMGARLSIGNTRRSLGELSLRGDDLEGARAHFDTALSIYEDVGDRRSIQYVLYGFGNMALREGDSEEACRLWVKCFSGFGNCYDKRSQGLTAVKLARFGPKDAREDWRNQARTLFAAMKRQDYIDKFVDGSDNPDNIL